MNGVKNLISRFYDYVDPFYILVRKDGVFVVETPDTFPQETVLRLFMKEAEAIKHRSLSQFKVDTKVGKTTILDLWDLLDRIESSSLRQYGRSVRVEVSAIDGDGNPITLDILHSSHEQMRALMLLVY